MPPTTRIVDHHKEYLERKLEQMTQEVRAYAEENE